MEEGRFCGSIWLAAEIALVKPKVIVGLGKVALRFFLGHEAASSAPGATGSTITAYR